MVIIRRETQLLRISQFINSQPEIQHWILGLETQSYLISENVARGKYSSVKNEVKPTRQSSLQMVKRSTEETRIKQNKTKNGKREPRPFMQWTMTTQGDTAPNCNVWYSLYGSFMQIRTHQRLKGCLLKEMVSSLKKKKISYICTPQFIYQLTH